MQAAKFGHDNHFATDSNQWCSKQMSKLNLNVAPSPADKQTVKEMFFDRPLMERGKPLIAEMLWVLHERADEASHDKTLPDYCYNIFEVLQRTYFKGFPLLSETVMVMDPAGMKTAKTVEAAKKVLRVDWKNLGRLIGLATRCIRFAELEAANDNDDLGDMTPEKTKELLTLIYGSQWVECNPGSTGTANVGETSAVMLNQYIAPAVSKLESIPTTMGIAASQWSPEAMVEITKGMAEGMESFINNDGQLAGESPRSGIYTFLLLAWPEIKAMLDSSPKKTMRDLHEWMKPFMRVGICTYIDIETLRDVCAPPPSGIGLSLRPPKARSPKSSA